MRNLLYAILITASCFLSSCNYQSGSIESILTSLGLFFQCGHSIELNGLEGVDTLALPGDKEQIAASVLANIDTLWVQLRDSLIAHPDVDFAEYLKNEDFLYDPTGAYTVWTFYIDPDNSKHLPLWKRYKFLSDMPHKFYNTHTDMIVYNKDKLLCWAFVVIEQHQLGGMITNKVPFYCGYSVIGKRTNINEPFKVYIRNRSPYQAYEKGWEKRMENDALYVPGYTYDVRDVYSANENKLPVVSDPDFFDKHPLFYKFNDSTYNFEWYNVNEKRYLDKKTVAKKFNYPF